MLIIQAFNTTDPSKNKVKVQQSQSQKQKHADKSVRATQHEDAGATNSILSYLYLKSSNREGPTFNWSQNYIWNVFRDLAGNWRFCPLDRFWVAQRTRRDGEHRVLCILYEQMSPLRLPAIYPILDRGCFADAASLVAAARELAVCGCRLMQYRNKTGSAREMLSDARELRRVVGRDVMLIMNDRADLALAAGFDGVHVGQDDLSVESVRKVVGPKMIVGASTHNPEQLRLAYQTSADYLAIGPVFATASKANPDPVVGLEGVRAARQLTSRPLVAIGGITLGNAESVMEAGADGLALISALVPEVAKSYERFLEVLL